MDTYEQILESMRSDYLERTGSDPDDASDIGIRLRVLAAHTQAAFAELEWLKRQMFPGTASGEYLDRHAQTRGITRKSGTRAEGEVTFSIPFTTNHQVTIPMGTVVGTFGESVQFETTEDTAIAAGSLTARAHIRAVNEGRDANVKAGAVCMFVTPTAEVDNVENAAPITGGSDRESDSELRARLIDSFINPDNGTNKAYYLAQALSVDGVAAASVVPRARGAGTVDVYVTSADGSPSAALLAKVRNRLRQAREINVDVAVSALHIVPMNVYMELAVKSGYDRDEVEEECKAAIRSYFNSLGGGQTVYVSGISEAVAHVPGVLNHSMIQQLISDTAVPADSVARCGTISISERD